MRKPTKRNCPRSTSGLKATPVFNISYLKDYYHEEQLRIIDTAKEGGTRTLLGLSTDKALSDITTAMLDTLNDFEIVTISGYII